MHTYVRAREELKKLDDMKSEQITNITCHAEVSEKSIERCLVARAKKLGLPCLKYSNPSVAGYPDRLLVLPDGQVVWVELKSKGRKPTKLQLARHAELSDLRHSVKVIDNRADVDALMDTVALALDFNKFPQYGL